MRMIDLVVSRGGRCLLVGGGVISHLADIPVKDWDIEVYGLTYQEIVDLLVREGYKPTLVGKSFGVITVEVEGLSIDFSLPRLDSRNGIGHKGFDVECNADLSPEEAARRRDLTINSMMLDLSTGELVDPYGGQKDLAEGRIRATDPSTFVEDPLRVLRVMQLVARKGKFVESSTVELCRSMVGEFPDLPKERVFEEFNKLLMKPEKPSIGLKFLKDSGWIRWFPELEGMVDCPQNPEYHPEGDVWVHTLMVVDNAARARKEVDEEWRRAFMYAALLHDVGKPSTLDDDLSCKGHDKAGEPLARAFMERLTNQEDLIKKVEALVGAHMRPGQLIQGKAGLGAWKRLHNLVPLEVAGYLSKCDSCGRTGWDWKAPHPPSEACFELAKEFGQEPIAPALMGRHLVERGMKPGPIFGRILKVAYEYQLDTGETDLDVLFSVGKEA